MEFFFRIRCASGRMRQDTLLSSCGLATPPFPPPPFTFSPGARPILSGVHGCGGWLGLVLYIGPGRLGGGTGVALGVGWGGVGGLYLGEGRGTPVGWPLSPLTLRGGPLFKVLTVTPQGVCVCVFILELVLLPGPIRCVVGVGGCVRFELWGFVVVCWCLAGGP
eukprot:scaffold17933_cov93-Isochrysis_galbana.AAC.1